MKTTLLTILTILTLTTTTSADPEEQKSPALLLQQALYAENIEGNLEKAITLYQQLLEQYNQIEQTAAKATYQLGMCHLKKENEQKAAEYFQEVVNYYPLQSILVKKAQTQLDKMGISEVKGNNIFDILGPEICSYIGSKYGEICAEAGMKKLYSNSHIYVFDKNFTLYTGGMGYVYNWTVQPITERYHLSRTTNPDQKLYGMLGDEMDIEIVPDEQQKGYYHVFWNPQKPLNPGEFFNYGWTNNNIRQLPKETAGKYPLKMNNHLGSHGYETFFLAVPQGTILSDQSVKCTDSETYNDWTFTGGKKKSKRTKTIRSPCP